MTKSVAENIGRVPATQVKKMGPRTPRGKAASSKNARKHGLTSKDALIPEESVKEFQALRTQLGETLQPVGALEKELVERVLMCMWRLRRAYRVETSIYADKLQEFEGPEGLVGFAGLVQVSKDSKLGHIYEMAMSAIDKVTRHEATYERSMYKALHELERLQKARAGEYVPAPAVADVTLHSPAIDQAGATPE